MPTQVVDADYDDLVEHQIVTNGYYTILKKGKELKDDNSDGSDDDDDDLDSTTDESLISNLTMDNINFDRHGRVAKFVSMLETKGTREQESGGKGERRGDSNGPRYLPRGKLVSV